MHSKDVTQTEFAEFVEQTQASLLRFATVLCGSAAHADDIVTDVLGRAYERWDRIGEVDHPNAYVRRMIVNEYLSWRRRTWRTRPVADLTEHAGSVPDHAERHADRSALAQQLARLPRKQRAAVVLRYYEGWSDEQIAELMGVSAGAIRSNVSRGLAALRIELTEPAPTRLIPTEETRRAYHR